MCIRDSVKIAFGGIVVVMEVDGPDLAMMGCRMVFSEVIGFVEFAFSPNYMKLSLANSVACPLKLHVDCLGPFLFDGIVGDTGSGAVVGDDDSGWLRIPKFFEGDANGARFFTVVK